MSEDYQNKQGRADDEQMQIQLPGIPDIEAYSQDALRSMFLAIKSANSLPSSGDEYDFYSSFSGFRTVMKAEGKNILALMSKLLQREGTKGYFEKLDLEDQFDFLIDTNDSILERISNACDECTGVKKKDDDLVLASISNDSKVITTSWNRKSSNIRREGSIQLLSAKNINRPQMRFKDKIDNSNSPFVPSIKEKPNALKPLAIILENTEFGEEYSHPYEVEIEKFTPSEDHLSTQEPVFPKSLNEMPLKFIDKVDDLLKLSEALNNVDKFAVDLEAHSYRSFLGFTCLMQISTVDSDYVIDVLELRSDLFVLNESFTNPRIVKIFHGASSDIEWLQRDFGIYIVNLFDTYHASVLLNMSRHSLAFLLSHYCKVIADKKYQLADWRIRPLPEKMINYAREDTHYLIYIYECMKKKLIESGNEEKNLLKSVFTQSKITCLRRFRKPIFDEKSHLNIYKKSKKYFNQRQMHALESLYEWRDTISRMEDESTGYVLPNHMLLHICEVLPREHQGILACCNPLPPLVKQQLNEIHLIILQARRESLTAKVEVGQTDVEIIPALRAVDTEGLLHCPHDLCKSSDPNPDLPVLLASMDIDSSTLQRNHLNKTSNVLIKRCPIFKVFEKHSDTKKSHTVKRPFISPYERYKATEKEALVEEKDEDEENEEVQNAVDYIISKGKMEASNESSTPQKDGDATEEAKEEHTSVCDGSVEDARPLRSKAKISRKPNKKKKKKSTLLGDSEPKSKMPRVDKGSDEQSKPFKAFDYSQVNYNQGGSRQTKQFNPDTSVSNMKVGGKSRSKQKRGQKSSQFNFGGGPNKRGRGQNTKRW